jgi:serine phosphatase RsbU (regulator of sigma subunit)
MAEPPNHYEVFAHSLNRQGEELCGDQVKTLRTRDRTIVVLSDGLGTGVKANILSRLTSTIIVTMIREDAPLQEVMHTVVGTLPLCKVRKIAYATFAAVEIQHATGEFKVVNFDNPAPLFLRQGRLRELSWQHQTIEGKQLEFAAGVLERDDFLGVLSDGVVYAGMGGTLHFGWGREQVAACLETAAAGQPRSAEHLVRAVMRETESLYGGQPGDDATFVGILARQDQGIVP